MDPFLAAQAADSFDSAPMLIQVVGLDEHGDQLGAEVLWGLVKSGTPSLHALDATLCPMSWKPDLFKAEFGARSGDESGDGTEDGSGSGSGDGLVYGDGDGYGYGTGLADG